ncbi:uncharacterized protein B0J16DRAFT_405803 [Fusarium flagelliforme]|uniref:uncharacterized protein n=1 Tax=Fusarium flagelliforme TaxID=2675880 RepID=UPI001E8E91FC|nr:uncharacterized protein B0J16DRAFT_405803 [Fusarium flagelliforme]KAH7173421.1 hypothetical protein B0J16DRAFT_405803 [Fusarium flagelliforme]
MFSSPDLHRCWCREEGIANRATPSQAIFSKFEDVGCAYTSISTSNKRSSLAAALSQGSHDPRAEAGVSQFIKRGVESLDIEDRNGAVPTSIGRVVSSISDAPNAYLTAEIPIHVEKLSGLRSSPRSLGTAVLESTHADSSESQALALESASRYDTLPSFDGTSTGEHSSKKKRVRADETGPTGWHTIAIFDLLICRFHVAVDMR